MNLPELILLNLRGNQMTGSIPDFGNLTNLESIYLGYNNLIGSIPNFSFLPKLKYLDLEKNNLSGSVPNFINLPSLDVLNLQSNQLTGTIPNFDKLGVLQSLRLSFNQLSGIIPDFDNLKNLKNLDLMDNQLSGPLPSFDNTPDLITLFLSSNQLSGTIPNFNRLNSLNYLWLDNNRLTGTIPNFNMPNINEFKFHHNQLFGGIPNFNNPKDLKWLWVDNNKLSELIQDFTEALPALSLFYANNNNYTFSDLINSTLANKAHIDAPPPKSLNPADSFIYAPQQKIYSDTTITIAPCTDYTLDLKIDDTVTTSTYAWFRNGVPFRTIKGSNKLSFKGFTADSNGTYTVLITNPLAPQLTLESHPIRLTSSGAISTINNPRDTSLSCGLSFTLRPITGQNLTNPAYFTGPGRTGTQYNVGQFISLPTTLYVNSGAGNCADEDTFRIQFVSPQFVLISDIVPVKYETSTNFDVLANDQIPAGLSITVTIDQPQNGRIIYSQSTGRGTYTPNDNFSGKEIINYTVCINGCPVSCKSSTHTFEVEGPCGDRNSLVLPNIIFPTGSGANRFFIVEAITKCPNSWGVKPHKLQVFNRWGDLVYRNDNYLNDWAGTNTAGQPLPEGTYYYLLDLGSVAAPIKGYVAIVR